MKKLILLSILSIWSLSVFAQTGSQAVSGIKYRVNDTTTYQSAAATAHAQGYADQYFNNQAVRPHFDIWNGSSYTHVFDFNGGGGLSGTVGVPNGGTGRTSNPSGEILYGNGTSPIASSANLKYDGTTVTMGSSTDNVNVTSSTISRVGPGGSTLTVNGDPSTTTDGGSIFIQSGGSSVGQSGEIRLLPGSFATSAARLLLGFNNIQTGQSTDTSSPVNISSNAGNSTTTEGQGVSITSGSAYSLSGNGKGGDITLSPGIGHGSGVNGKVILPGVTQDNANSKILTIDGSDNLEWRDASSISGGGGTVTSIATTSPITGGTITSTGTIGINQATTSTDGYLSATNWNTFNGKQNAITFGTGVLTALGVNIGSAGAPVLFNGAAGTPSSLTGTNITGTASGLTAGTVTTNANLTGHITSTGNAAVLGSFSSSNLSTALSDEVGTGSVLFSERPINTQTGTTYTSVLSDRGAQIVFTNSGSITFTIPTAASVAYPDGTEMWLKGIASGILTVVPPTGGSVSSTAGNLLSQSPSGTDFSMVLKKRTGNTWALDNGSSSASAVFSVTDGIIDLTATGSPGTAVLNAMGISATISGISSVADGDIIYANGVNTFTNKNVFNTAQTSYIHLKAGTATAGTAPFGFTSGALLTVPVAGKVEFNGANYNTSTALNRVGSGGSIADFTSDVANSGTSETDIQTYTTKASTLGSIGEKITFDFTMTLSDITSTAQIKVVFAGTTIGDTGALTVSATGAVVIRGYIIRTGSSTARASVNISSPTASTAVYTAETDLTGLTFTNTNILKTTATAAGAGGGSGDITGKLGVIYWWPAAAN
jgi:hypothetical protein